MILELGASLPTRERGLKLVQNVSSEITWMSLPTRERGLKHADRRRTQRGTWSLPTRERGLKHGQEGTGSALNGVAPHAGAWIETLDLPDYRENQGVAPHAGAWIETTMVSPL